MNTTPYFGGKSGSGTYQTIINQIPPHELYIEGFAGMAGILRNMKTDARCLLIEKDHLLFPMYKEAGFYETASPYSFINNHTGHNRMAINDDAIHILKTYPLDSINTFIYLDPPYPLASRKSGPKYRHELTDDQHVELLQTINNYVLASIAISTYPNPIYDYYLKNWRMIEFESQTRRGKATERLYMNYDKPTELHDYQYIGHDYRDRERIARMQKRWKAKFSSLSPLEKKAMLQQLKALADPTVI